jgi:hypothetical protein
VEKERTLTRMDEKAEDEKRKRWRNKEKSYRKKMRK